MKRTGHIRNSLVLFLGCAFTLLLALTAGAQQPTRSYTVKDGKMFIALSKQLNESSIDSFIARYDLYDLALKDCMNGIMLDTLRKLGWNINLNTSEMFIISKPLFSANEFRNPGDKIILTEKMPSFGELFPAVSSRAPLGVNRFRNKAPFRSEDSVVTFFLRNNNNAGRVMLAGSFNDWSPDNLAMGRTDSGWIAFVKLGTGKYWYKFIVDGNWTIDKDNQLYENDGMGNVNSVFFKTNTIFRLNGYANARRVYLAGSFNDWKSRDLAMQRTASGWELPLYLADGTHTYRFVVDNKWIADPGNPERLPNEYHDYNSVIRLGKSYVFSLDGYTDAKQVILAGSFNRWRKDELVMNKTANGWELHYTLGPGNYEYVFIVDGKTAQAAENNSSGNLYFIIDPNHEFRLKGFPEARQVYIAGDFNNWSPNTFAMKKEGDEWVIKVHLSDGKHLYKFVVDEKWIIDPANKLWEQNEHGTGNSVIWVDK